MKEAAEGQQSTAAESDNVENMTEFSKVKRDLALKLGVDPSAFPCALVSYPGISEVRRFSESL